MEQFQRNLVRDVASGTTAHHNLLKLLPWVNLDLFFLGGGEVKFCNLCFYIEKYDNDGFFGNYCSSNLTLVDVYVRRKVRIGTIPEYLTKK